VSNRLPPSDDYASGLHSFITGLRPQDAIALPMAHVIELLSSRYGEAIKLALSESATDLLRPLEELPEAVRSPRGDETDTTWLRRTNMVGVNVRTVGDYAGVIKYALTLPSALDSIHLLPIWEPGVVESLYGPSSWNLNTRFFSPELYEIAPNLDTTPRQLRAVSNLLHVMGKTIGMDVIPHTDRFSEAAVGMPQLFEWMRVTDRVIVDHSDDLAETAEGVVFSWLRARGSAVPHLNVPDAVAALFSLPEETRLAILFGSPDDVYGRIDRRVDCIRSLKEEGLEPVPATMGVPFRGLVVDPDPDHTTVDEHGMEWTDYLIAEPQSQSRVFSPLARYKLYERVDGNRNWEIDFSRPRPGVWEYVCDHYARARHIGNFDFMRGDMSHVQMRPSGVPDVVDGYYDILGTVKEHIQREHDAPWFGYFAESFLPPRDVFQFGEELDHLEASLADATVGDLQSLHVGSRQFLARFRRYIDDVETRLCAPAFTIGTADKDDPRFDGLYEKGNEARLFTALFLTDMPSYVGLGYEIRDIHREPVENERYTKLFVFREHGDSNVYPSKARFDESFVWGDNQSLFEGITSIREHADEVLPKIANYSTRWLIPPDATGHRGIAAWTQEPDDAAGDQFVFLVNYHESSSGYFGIPGLASDAELHLEFSTGEDVPEIDRVLRSNHFFHRIEDLFAGECRTYRLVTPASPSLP